MPQQNLKAMLPTVNYLSHPYSEGFSSKATIHPKTHTPPQHLTKSGVEGSLGHFLVFVHNWETLFSFDTWQVPLDAQISSSIHEPSKRLALVSSKESLWSRPLLSKYNP